MTTSRYATPVLVLIGAVIVGLYFLGDRGADQPDQVAFAPSADAKPDDAKHDPKLEKRAALARAKAEQLALLDRARKARAKLEEEFPREASRWEGEIASLPENARGRVLATSDIHVQAFFREFNAEKATSEEVKALARQVALLIAPLEDAAADPTSSFVPDGDFVAKLDSISSKASEAVAGFRERREAIERLLRIAAAENRSPADKTLAAAFASLRDEADAERLRLEDARLRQEREDEAVRVAKDAEAARQAKLAEDELRRQTEAAAHDRRLDILAKANDPAVQAAFSPLLARASTRVSGGKYLMGEHPAAYADIQSRGAFQSPESLKFLIIKPDGGRGVRKGKQQGWEEAVRRFSDFEPLARVWVDQCKLLATAADAGKPCTPKS